MRVQLFDGALQQTRRILESDYKAAIPQYYNHSIQLFNPNLPSESGNSGSGTGLYENSGWDQISGTNLSDSPDGLSQCQTACKAGRELAEGVKKLEKNGNTFKEDIGTAIGKLQFPGNVLLLWGRL